MIAPGMYVKTKQPASSDYICWRYFDPDSDDPLAGHDVYMQFGLVISVTPDWRGRPVRGDIIMLLSRRSELGFSIASRWESL